MSKRDKARRPQVIIDMAEYERLKEAAEHPKWAVTQSGPEQITIYPAAGLTSDDYLVVLKADYNRRKADAELGALVRRMPRTACLTHCPMDEKKPGIAGMPCQWKVSGPASRGYGDTPEAALKAAVGEE